MWVFALPYMIATAPRDRLAVWGEGGGRGECGRLPCAVDSVFILSLVSSK